jgi:hypothetical protein
MFFGIEMSRPVREDFSEKSPTNLTKSLVLVNEYKLLLPSMTNYNFNRMKHSVTKCTT